MHGKNFLMRARFVIVGFSWHILRFQWRISVVRGVFDLFFGKVSIFNMAYVFLT